MIVQGLLLLLPVTLSPFVGFYAHNLSQDIELGEFWAYPVLTAALVACVYLALRAVFRAPDYRLSSLLAVLVIVSFNFETTSQLLADHDIGRTGQKVGWILLLVATLALTGRFGAGKGFHSFLVVFAAVNLAMPLPKFLLYDGSAQDAPSALEAYPLEPNPIWSGNAVTTPNIYWIVADSYPSQLQLREFYDLDNSRFVNSLRAKGFYVADESYSNYSATILSVPTTLQMEMAFPDGGAFMEVRNGIPTMLRGATNRGLMDAIAGDNRTVAYLRQLGYRYVHFDSGYSTKTRCRGYEDVCLSAKRTSFSELQASLLKLLPWEIVQSALFRVPMLSSSLTVASGTSVPEFGEGLAALSLQQGPLFTYAHFMSPHDPYTTDADCNVLPRDQPLTRNDGREPFWNQIQCLNRHLGALLDDLLARDSDAIVILSADHGPRHSALPETSLADLTAIEVRESLGILNAMRLPESCRSALHPRLTPVNTMRLVFACLGGHEPRFVEPQFFVDRPYSNPEYGKMRRVEVF
jgi:hypothetical protein